MLYGIAAALIFTAMVPAYGALKKRHPTVKWDSLFLGGVLLLFAVGITYGLATS